MKQANVIQAYKTLNELSQKSLPIKAAYMIHCLMKELRPLYEVEEEMEKKLLAQYQGRITKQGLEFGDPSNSEEANGLKAGFFAELEQLLNMEVSQEIAHVHIRISDLEGLSLRARVLDDLEGFVDFEE